MAKHDIFMSFSLLSRCRSDLDRPLLRGVRSPLLLRPHLKIKKKKQKKRGNFPFPQSTPASSRIPIFRKSGGGRGSHRTRDISQREREVRRDIREKDQEEIVAICHHRREREKESTGRGNGIRRQIGFSALHLFSLPLSHRVPIFIAT